MGIGSWILLVVLLAHGFEVPGCYGPPQYWHDEGRSFMWVRVVALLLALLGFVLAFLGTAATIAALSWRATVVPFMAMVAYGAGMWAFASREFWPTA
jgi:hypothetical protein